MLTRASSELDERHRHQQRRPAGGRAGDAAVRMPLLLGPLTTGGLCHLRLSAGASHRAIAHPDPARSLASLDQYIRIESAPTDNAATALDL